MKNWSKINWKGLFLDNWILKVASITVAFILWFVVITVDDPVDEKTFTNIKVNLLNTEALEDLGMVYEVLDGTDTVKRVTFEAPKSVRDVITEEDIIAEADLDNITVTQTVEIKFSCPKYSNEVSDFSGNISNVKLNVEYKTRKYINIEQNIIGEVADGYKIGSVKIGRNRLEIEGPASKVDSIERAVVDINVSGVTDDINTQADVYFLDGDGNQVSYASVQQNVTDVSVDVNILKTKEVPVEYIPAGEPADGYLVTGVVEATPQTILVAGEAAVLDSFNVLTITDELDLTGLTENLEKTFILSLPYGVSFADSDFDRKATVTVYIEEAVEKNITLRSSNLSFVNLPEGVTAEIVAEQEMPFVSVTGLAADLTSLREATLTGTIDVAAWMEENQLTELAGIYSLPVELELTEGQYAESTVYVHVLFGAVEEITVE